MESLRAPARSLKSSGSVVNTLSGSRIRERAFTLIELLVVIGIIALLAALAFPAYRKVMLLSKAAKATSSLRQMGIALQSYIGDNNGKLPGPVTVAVYNYGRDTTPLPNDLPHFGAYLAGYLGAAPDSATRDYKLPLKALKCPLLSQPAQDSSGVANYITVDYDLYSTPDNRFGEWAGLSFSVASQKANQPKTVTALTTKARQSPIVCTADQQNWVSVNNGPLPAKGAFDGKRLWLFIDGSIETNDKPGIYMR